MILLLPYMQRAESILQFFFCEIRKQCGSFYYVQIVILHYFKKDQFRGSSNVIATLIILYLPQKDKRKQNQRQRQVFVGF